MQSRSPFAPGQAITLGAFAAAAITGQGITTEETLAAPRALVDLVTHQLERTGRSDSPAGRADSELDAEIVLAATAGITQGMIQGHYSPQSAIALVEHLLDRIALPSTDTEQPGQPRR